MSQWGRDEDRVDRSTTGIRCSRPGKPSRQRQSALGAEPGLICGFEVGPDGTSPSIGIDEVCSAKPDAGRVVRRHFNASHAGAKRWLARQDFNPEAYVRLIEQHEPRVQSTAVPEGLVGVLSELAFGDAVDPSEVTSVWVYAAERLLVTPR